MSKCFCGKEIENWAYARNKIYNHVCSRFCAETQKRKLPYDYRRKIPVNVIHATTPLNSNPLTLTPTKDFAVSNVSRKPCRATKERNTHLYSQLSMKILMA